MNAVGHRIGAVERKMDEVGHRVHAVGRKMDEVGGGDAVELFRKRVARIAEELEQIQQELTAEESTMELDTTATSFLVHKCENILEESTAFLQQRMNSCPGRSSTSTRTSILKCSKEVKNCDHENERAETGKLRGEWEDVTGDVLMGSCCAQETHPRTETTLENLSECDRRQAVPSAISMLKC